MLLPRHNHPHLGFGIVDQVAAQIESDVVDRASEFEGRLVEMRHRRAGVCAYSKTAGEAQAERRRVRELSLPDQLAIDVKLGRSRRAFAVGDVRRPGDLELEAQFMRTPQSRARLQRHADNHAPRSYARIVACHPARTTSNRHRCRHTKPARLPPRPRVSPPLP